MAMRIAFRQLQPARAGKTACGRLLLTASALALLLAGCASAPPRRSEVAVVNAQSGCHAPPPNLRAAYNRSYTVGGRTYTPLRSADGYDEVGLASWYGWESGATTAMGTRFDPHEFTAASRVLPLPTCVQVTNLDNGLSALVLVNDRGPFVSGRILDLSMGAAAALGITRTGTAPVRVVALPEGANAPLQLAQQNAPVVRGGDAVRATTEDAGVLRGAAAPQQFAPQPVATAVAQPAPETAAIAVQVLPPLPAATSAAAPQPGASAASNASALSLPSDGVTAQPGATGIAPLAPVAAGAPQTFVQVGAFTLQANAQAQRAQLIAAGIDNVQIVPGYIRGQTFYRVQIGPLTQGPSPALLDKLQRLGLTQYAIVEQ